jgi:hypothetical protein
MAVDFHMIKPPISLERYERFFWTVDYSDSISGKNHILEGGGVFVQNNQGIANFLVDDTEKGKQVLEAKGIKV